MTKARERSRAGTRALALTATILAGLGAGTVEGASTVLNDDPPSPFGALPDDWVIVPSFSELHPLRAGKLSDVQVTATGFHVVGGRPNGQARVCASARRTTVFRSTRVDLDEYGCKEFAAYRFDPLSWRATTSEHIGFWFMRTVYRRSAESWVSVTSKTTRSGSGAISLTWSGVGEMQPSAFLALPTPWWPAGGAALVFRKSARVSGVVRFPGLRGIVRLSGADGDVTWWTG